MKQEIMWLVISCLTVAVLLLTSCAPAVTGEEDAAPPAEEEVAPPPEEEAAPPDEVISHSYTQEEVAHLLQVGLGAEYGNPSRVIRKWSGEVRISVFGEPTEEDLTALDNVIDDINELTGEQITLQVVDESPDITIWFVPSSEMHQYEENYVPGNVGFFWTRWNSSDEIYSANILISSDRPIQEERSHLIREELTQSLGLMNDSWTYLDSIFYEGWTTVQEYTYFDRKVIEMLYLEEIQCGINEEQIKSIFSNGRGRQLTSAAK